MFTSAREDGMSRMHNDEKRERGTESGQAGMVKEARDRKGKEEGYTGSGPSINSSS
jgi:hypothetical protein